MTDAGTARWCWVLLPLLLAQPALMLVAYQLAETREGARLTFCAGMLALITWLWWWSADDHPVMHWPIVLAAAAFIWCMVVLDADPPFPWKLAALSLQTTLWSAWAALWWALRTTDSLPARLALYGELATGIGVAFNIVANFVIADPWALELPWRQRGIWEVITGTPEPMILVWGVWAVASLTAWAKWRWSV